MIFTYDISHLKYFFYIYKSLQIKILVIIFKKQSLVS